MSTVRQILRCIQRSRLSVEIPETGSKLFNRSVRCASTSSTRNKSTATGRTNEGKIFVPQYGDVTYPDIPIHEYVWKDVKSFENHTALVCGVSGRKYTYSQARDAANYVAKSLLSMGLKKGDVVALIAPNYPETVLGILGALEADLLVTTMNPIYTVDEMSRQLKSSGAKAVITVAEIASTSLAAAKAALPPGSPFVVIEDGTGPVPEGTVPFKDLVERGKSLPPLPSGNVCTDDTALLLYSSGTTGLPKGVMLSHRNIVANIEMTDVTGNGELFHPATDTFQEVLPVFLPIFHIFGLNCATLPRLSTGSKLITMPKFTADIFMNVVKNHKITGLFCVPPVVLFLAASPLVEKTYLQNMRIALSGAAPLAQADVERLYEKLGVNVNDLKFCQGFGMTETSPVTFLEKTGKKFASIGKNVAGCQARLVDPVTNEGISVAGQTGELWVKGPHIMKGYLNNEAATRETIVEDGWLKTGDIAYFDEDSDFFITDRLKELIKVKGFQVAPAELEALLRSHPDVEEAAVIGVPDDRCGEVPKAFVLPKKGKKPTEEDIKKFMKGKVSEFKELRGGVAFVSEIPKSQTGKILRSKLKS